MLYLVADVEARRGDELCVEDEGGELLPGHCPVEHPPGSQQEDGSQEYRLLGNSTRFDMRCDMHTEKPGRNGFCLPRPVSISYAHRGPRIQLCGVCVEKSV